VVKSPLNPIKPPFLLLQSYEITMNSQNMFDAEEPGRKRRDTTRTTPSTRRAKRAKPRGAWQHRVIQHGVIRLRLLKTSSDTLW
jgi:hypothetical protein